MNISIALCTYNGSRYLADQLKSFELQSRRPDELLVCDDKSSDSTLDMLHAFKGKAPFPVHIHENEHNLGSTKNFEKAISLCEGDIIALSDQDDVWKPNKLSRVAEAFEQYPGIGYVFSDAELVDEQLRSLKHRLWESIDFQGSLYRRFARGDQFEYMLRRPVVTGAALAFRSSLRPLLAPFPTDMLWIHDGWIAIVASAVGKPGFPLPEPLILYRQHPAQQLGIDISEDSRIIKIRQSYHDTKRAKQKLLELRAWEEKNRGSYAFLKERLLFAKEHFGIDTDAQIEHAEEFQNELRKYYVNRLLLHSVSGPRKLRLIYEELRSGRYKRFASSWLSAARDLIMKS